MDAIWRYFKVQLPAYLKAVPLPKKFAGFLTLSREEWLELLPLLVLVSVLVYLAIAPLFGYIFKKKEKRPRVNMKQDLESDKIATTWDMDDLGDKKVFCRCWKSNKFPLCDGSHNRHNKETGDNVGPLILEKTKKETKKEDTTPEKQS